MARTREVLIVATYGIDAFYGVISEMERHECIAFAASTPQITREYIQNRQFDAIIINLEPDGKGGVAEIDLLDAIASSPLQKNAICLGVSAEYPHSLPDSESEKNLKFLAGWLTLPIKPKALADHIIELIESTHKLTIKELMQAARQ